MRSTRRPRSRLVLIAGLVCCLCLAGVALGQGKGDDAQATAAALRKAAASARIAGYSLSKVQRWLHERCLPAIDKPTGLYRGQPRTSKYRRYAVGVRKFLRPQGEQNVLLIVFSSPLRFLKQARKRFAGAKGISSNKYLRKCHSDFGSYLGARPHSMKVGVFRDVVLDVPDRTWRQVRNGPSG